MQPLEETRATHRRERRDGDHPIRGLISALLCLPLLRVQSLSSPPSPHVALRSHRRVRGSIGRAALLGSLCRGVVCATRNGHRKGHQLWSQTHNTTQTNAMPSRETSAGKHKEDGSEGTHSRLLL